MSKVPQTYEVHKYGTCIGRGTVDEIAALTGLSPSSVRRYSTHPYGDRWRIEREIKYYALDQVNLTRLHDLKETGGYTYPELGEHVNLSERAMWHRFNGRSRWTHEEVSVMADLFYVDEGELLYYTTKGEPLHDTTKGEPLYYTTKGGQPCTNTKSH